VGHSCKHFYSAFAWFALIASPLILHAADKTDFQCLEEFESVVLTNQTLTLSGVSITTLTNGKTYLLSLGTVVMKNRQDSDVQAKLDTRKVAEAKARKAAAEYLTVEVQSVDRLLELRKTEKVTSNEGLKSQVTKLIKVREQIITQKAKAVLAGSKIVATWIGDDGNSFNAVVASEIVKTVHLESSWDL